MTIKRLVVTIIVAAGISFDYALAEPVVPIPTLDPGAAGSVEVALGEKLFHSPKLSKGNQISCASCHNLTEGGDDGRAASVGVDGKVGTINAPTVFNSSLNLYQFWDGRAFSLEDQVEGPIHNSLEMDSSWDEAIDKLAADDEFQTLFNRAYSDGINAKNIAKAIATFERQLLTPNSSFDLYLKGEETALSDSAVQGYQLFKSLGCVSCHQGVNLGGNLFQYFGVVNDYFEGRENVQSSDYGRFNVTHRESDRFKFRVPSLRNVALTAPYFHDGSAATLKKAIEVMALYQLGRNLSDGQLHKLEEFLISLNGDIPRIAK